MNVFDGIKNFLQIVNDNWTTIVIIIGLIIALANKIRDYMSKSDEEKIAIAKKQIQEIMLKLVTEAEMDYLEWEKAGSVKRAQVVEKLFEMYPILSKVTDQESLIMWVDSVIDEALLTMKEMFKENVEMVETAKTVKTYTIV